MKFIPPLEISSKIMTLIEEAEVELILVSPYVSMSGWTKMQNCLRRAIERKVKITFYARQNAVQDLSFISNVGITLILVKDLHAKVYINENYAIVSSQNISQYSDANSIDIGYQTENISERGEISSFIKRYISKTSDNKNIETPQIEKLEERKKELSIQQLDSLYNSLKKHFSYANLKKTSTYIFCDKLLPFADVMIDSELTVKVNKRNNDFYNIVEVLKSLQNNPNFSVRELVIHKQYYYLTYIPKDANEFDVNIGYFIEKLKNILSLYKRKY